MQGADLGSYFAARQRSGQEDSASAVDLWREGQVEQRVQMACQADLSAFEAYLIEASRSVGDRNLALVDLRWRLACSALAQVPGLPGDFREAVTIIRGRLGWAVGPVEAARLHQRLADPARLMQMP